jgi:hypothetical protein
MLKSELRLSEEQYSEIETLAAANYAPRSIAKYLGVNETHFIKEWKINTSLVRHHYDKGLLEAEFLIAEGLLTHAKSGNITAAQEFKKIARVQRVENLKNDILFGHED